MIIITGQADSVGFTFRALVALIRFAIEAEVASVSLTSMQSHGARLASLALWNVFHVFFFAVQQLKVNTMLSVHAPLGKVWSTHRGGVHPVVDATQHVNHIHYSMV